ncbi:Pentatricopeptide repeat-containing protein At2g31400, partial [Durusdinium trenchii]
MSVSLEDLTQRTRKAHSFLQTEGLIRDAKERQLQLDLIFYGTAISSCVRGRSGWSNALGLLVQMSGSTLTPDLVACSAALATVAKAATPAWQTSVQLLREMQEMDLKMNVIPFETCITCCGKASQLTPARKVYGDLDRYRLEKTVITYSALISACERSAAWIEAISLLWQAAQSRIQMDAIIYGAAISACEKAANWSWALLFLEELCNDLEPNMIHYNATMSACEKSSYWEVALLLMQEAVARHLQRDVISFAACVSACEKAAVWPEALQLLRCAQTSLLETNSILCNAAISACGRGSEPMLALMLMKEMDRPETDTYNAAIGACLEDWPQALSLFVDLQQASNRPNLLSFNSTIHVLCVGLQWLKAAVLLEQCKDEHLQPDAASYDPILSARMEMALAEGAFSPTKVHARSRE